jgi:phosphopantothenoylcysteine decarboxylase/phosphopantothenate--cysteine ligase
VTTLASQRVLLGVSGGIAAYKAPSLVRELRRAGAEVRVVMTRAAAAFVAPLALQAVSGHPVRSAILDPGEESAMDHITLARWADRVVVAPATADLLARLAHGLADDLLTTVCLATTAPLAVAPAMNQQMWRAAATRDNLALLVRRGVLVLGPAEGEQACGEEGPGRMLEPAAIVQALADRGPAGSLAGHCALVTAGPTREPIDPVRFLSNRSSGKMGYAVAAACAEAGARVTLVSGPTALPTPVGVERVDVERAEELYREVMARVSAASLFIATAAVSDYRPGQEHPAKIKRSGHNLTLTLEPTPDTLAAVAALPRRPFTVGFAAETEQVAENALAKLERKGLDLIAANRVGPGGLGFEGDENALTVLWPGGSREIPRASKTEVARALVSLISERIGAPGRPEGP